MRASVPDPDTIAALLTEASQELILPRFRHLQDTDVHRKPTDVDPDDVVTVVDREVEERITQALAGMTPGTPVVGEEGAHARPELLRATEADEPLWILDPLDGTKNFARGDDKFGVMLAWVVEGRARAAWVMLPVRGAMFVAESGAGAFRDRDRLRVPNPPSSALPRGICLTRYMPSGLAEEVVEACHGRFHAGHESHCAAVEYTDVIEGSNDFVVYYRLTPWDHAAPALIVEESGGCVRHPDGTPYTARSRDRITVVARGAGIFGQVGAWLQSSGR